MKQYKLDVTNRLLQQAEEYCTVSLHQAARECGVSHLKTQECMEICREFLKLRPEYTAYRQQEHGYDSLFVSLIFSCNATPFYGC